MKQIFFLKNNKVRFALVLAQLLFTLRLFAQSEDNNHRKYWYYRTRLNNDFVKVGTDFGESMPFNQRGIYYRGITNEKNFNGLKLGDGTSTLGIYLAVLATEYRLLKNNGQNISKIKHELYCALNAMNRVDYYAETAFGKAPNLNGFFVRDDIRKDFAKNNYQHFNYYNNGINSSGSPLNRDNDRGFTSIIPNGMDGTETSWQSFQIDPVANREGILESQDQVYTLLVGLALTAHLVDGGETDAGAAFLYGSGQADIKQEAKNITARIVNYMKNSNGHNSVWQLYDPNGISIPESSGGNAIAYGYPISQAACFIVNNTDLPSFTLQGIPTNCYSFDDKFTYNNSIAGYKAWNAIDLVNGGFKMDQQVFYNNLAAVSNSLYFSSLKFNPLAQATLQTLQSIAHILCKWFGCPKWLQKAINNMLGALFLNVNYNVTALHLVQNTSTSIIPVEGLPHLLGTSLYHSPYLHGVLHGNVLNDLTSTSALVLNNTMRSLLNDAACEGAYNFKNGNWGDYEWSSDNRCEHTDRIGEQTPQFPGEYNGLDYMLYHNLYFLYNSTLGTIATNTVDLSDRIIHFALPTSNVATTIGNVSMPSEAGKNNTGTKSSPATIGAFETIVADNTINANADITYRAGKTIQYKSGFHVANGAKFHAFVQPYSCGDNDYHLKKHDDTKIEYANGNTGYIDVSMYETTTHGTGPIKWENKVPTVNEYSPRKELEMLDSLNTLLKSLIDVTSSEPVFKPGISIFPNPGTGKFIAINTVATDNYIVTDIVGNFVISGHFADGATEIDLLSSTPGVYFLNIIKASGIHEVEKLIIK